MNVSLRILVLLVGLGVFAIVFSSLAKRKINERSSILWLIIGLLVLLAGIFPDFVTFLAGHLGVSYEPSLVFLLATMALLLIEFRNNCHVADLEQRLRELAIQLSITKNELDQLKSLNEEDE